jgi:hypothetical protein
MKTRKIIIAVLTVLIVSALAILFILNIFNKEKGPILPGQAIPSAAISDTNNIGI